MGRKKLNQSGQSTIEFTLTLILILGFSFLYIKVALLYVYGNYVHYASFMSARALLSSGLDEEDQEQRAQAVLIETLKKGIAQPGTERWPALGQGQGGDFPAGAEIGDGEQYVPGDQALSWQQGVRYTFRSRLFIIPLGLDPLDNVIELTSESWLGRETSEDECREYIRQRYGGDVVLDNGC